MQDICIFSDTIRRFLMFRTADIPKKIQVCTADGTTVVVQEIRRNSNGGFVTVTFDASCLRPWSPERPVLYTAVVDGEKIRFGYGDIRGLGRQLLVNGSPFYIRGYIRGIVAHDHPNLTGKSAREGHLKNILQAKKYGFNLVRFHSTIPDEEFVDAADELGLFIHLELGFSYEYDAHGNKSRIFLDAERWKNTLEKYRNHPSVAIFCLGNEMHQSGHKPEAHELYEMGKKLAPNKLIMDNSGWGEYDRDSADIYSQHIAYFFPYKKHAAMFDQDFCWQNNGSMYDLPLEQQHNDARCEAKITRRLNPLRPVIAHEAIHYIDLPDYAALNRKFDAFRQKVGPEYLTQNQIVKPRYLTALPQLAEAKGMTKKLPELMGASQHFKMMAMKIYLERLRLSEQLCGYEMLQFADCLKYENRNGIVDCFDDDKFIPSEWFREFNSDTVLLADWSEETAYENSLMKIPVYLSHFGPDAIFTGDLRLFLRSDKNRELLFAGKQFTVGHGLSQLVEIKARFKTAGRYDLELEFQAGDHKLTNRYQVWIYSRPTLQVMPKLRVKDAAFAKFLTRCGETASLDTNLLFTDVLDDALWAPLATGKTVILDYHRDRKSNQYYWPGTFDRFKPCIWDRGNNLGGVIHAEWLRQTLGGDHYFDRHLYALIEAGYKINLDHFPVPVEELVSGVDSPVRDRMKGLLHGIKNFLPDDTMRNFCYLFAVKVGPGTLIVSTFNHRQFRQPAAAAYFTALINHASTLKTTKNIAARDLKNYLKKATAAGVIKEDVMTRFWELDDKPVEDTLFWEQAGVDLGKLGKQTD